LLFKKKWLNRKVTSEHVSEKRFWVFLSAVVSEKKIYQTNWKTLARSFLIIKSNNQLFSIPNLFRMTVEID